MTTPLRLNNFELQEKQQSASAKNTDWTLSEVRILLQLRGLKSGRNDTTEVGVP